MGFTFSFHLSKYVAHSRFEEELDGFPIQRLESFENGYFTNGQYFVTINRITSWITLRDILYKFLN